MGINGEVIWHQQKCYRPEYLDETHIEQDPEIWLKSLDEILKNVSGVNNGFEKVLGIVLTAQRSSLIPVDSTGKALRPALMWQDRRHIQVCERLKDDYPEIQSITGSHVNTAYSGPKMLWLKENEPEIYERAYKLLSPAEYLIYGLTGEIKIDQTYASRSLLFDIKRLDWSDYLLETWGLDRKKLSEIVPPASVVGEILPKWVERWNLPGRLPLITAGGDQQCSALGLGMVEEGDFEITAGTGGYAMTLSSNLPENARGCTINVSGIPGYYVVEGTMLACGCAFDFFRKLLYPACSYAEIDKEMETVEIGSNGIVILPFFQGSGSPTWSPYKSADIMGLTLSSTRAEISSACLEAIACELTDLVRLLESVVKIKASKVSIAGGLTNNKKFNDSLAALLNIPLIKPIEYESSIYGAFMSGCVALGIDHSHKEVKKRINPLVDTERINASSEEAEKYSMVLDRYIRAKSENHITNIEK